jgi:hypothetical protein
MSSGERKGYQGIVVARRSVSLSKAYLILGASLSVVGVVFSSLSGLVITPTTTVGAAAGASKAVANTAAAVPFLAVPFQALAAILFSTSVLLLFVYDKNNGVLEYLMSLGLTQGDIYKTYLKAALTLAGILVAFDFIADITLGLIEGTAVFALGIAALVVAFALPAVSFGTLLMMSFSSLQKQRVGSNQPLGMAVGAFLVFPTYLLPLVAPSAAFLIDLLLAGVAVVLSLLTYWLSSRWISREKLLP